MTQIEKLTERLQTIVNFQFTIGYYNSQTDSSISFICECGHSFCKSWKRILSTKTCPICSRLEVNKTNKVSFVGNKFNTILYNTEIVKTEMLKFGYILNNEYTQANTKVSVTCPECHVYDVSWSKFRQGRRCPICSANNKQKNLERCTGVTSKIKNHIEKTIKNYDFVWLNPNDYINRNSIMTIKCGHGHIFNSTWYKMQNNNLQSMYCRKCKTVDVSIGEMKIIEILNDKKIIYQKEKTYQDLKSKMGKFLRYDFYIPTLNILIEFDGIQHFKPYKKFGGLKRYEQIKYSDNLKNQYAIKNNIKLIRIPYTHYKCIQKIIKDMLDDGVYYTNFFVV